MLVKAPLWVCYENRTKRVGGSPAPDWREIPWLLKNSFSRNRQKSDRVRMPYKRFSLFSYTFPVTQSDPICRQKGLFQHPLPLS